MELTNSTGKVCVCVCDCVHVFVLQCSQCVSAKEREREREELYNNYSVCCQHFHAGEQTGTPFY